jgi:hypothetical protein
MPNNGFEMRELSEIEIFQIAGGGCPMGPGCNCPGSSSEPSEDGTLLFTTDCSGTINITHIVPMAPVVRI